MTPSFVRLPDLKQLLVKKSAFLFGPRGTGKSTLIGQCLPEARSYDLLDEKTYLSLLRDSSILEEENPGQNQLIIIDEVQKLPKLLDEVQRLIFKNNHRFLLTGSSSRKLKRSGANLLGGRAREYHLMPLVSREIPDFDLMRYLNRGGLPSIYLSDEPSEDLKSYVSLYLREEIVAEALTRRVDLFSRFLDVIGLNSGQELHLQNISSDSGVPVKTVQNYIEILSDTLIGFQLLPFNKSKKRKAITRSKYFLFDTGVTGYLAKRSQIIEGSEAFGHAFEQFIVLEIRAALEYLRVDLELQYWRTKTSFEVDLIIGDHAAFEIKSTNTVSERHLKGLKALREEELVKKFALICNVPHRRVHEGIEILPWREFLDELWSGLWF